MIYRYLYLPCILVLSIAAISPVAAQTSQNNERLRKALEKYPQADANKDGVLTLEEGKAFKKKYAGNRSKASKSANQPDFTDVSYGQHSKQCFDLWLAKSEDPTPLLVCIHGGGFKGGDKAKYHSEPIVAEMLKQGVSVATLNYRLTQGGKKPYPIPMHDCARAIQYLRHQAKKFNINSKRIAATGGSAGGCISLWLAFHDDMADTDSSDPIAQQSSRLVAVAPTGAQTTLDFDTYREIFDCKNLKEHGGFRPLFAIPKSGTYTLTQALKSAMTDASPVSHLTKDDPPVFLTYGGKDRPIDENSSPGHFVHHPKLGMFLMEKMEGLGLECHLQFNGGPDPESYSDATSFLLAKLKK